MSNNFSKEEQALLRSRLFRHLDGIVTAPSAFALKQKGVTEYILSEKRVSLEKLIKEFNANEGYLNVALRTLCSQGWLSQHADNAQNSVHFEINEKSEIAFQHFRWYGKSVHLLTESGKYHSRRFETEPFLILENLFESFKDTFNESLSDDPLVKEIQSQILSHIEGIILGPTLVHLGMSGMFHKYFMETRFRPEEFHKDPDSFSRLLDILTHFGWFNKLGGTYEFTREGLFFAKRASAYGVTVSYIPTLRALDELLFGNALALKSKSGEPEKHVDREMNVWGSGGAHAAYFKVIDDIITDVFNRPIDAQPAGVLDMGCGNGAFLAHIFSVIEKQTLRGTMLDEYPVTLIGVDYNEAALNVTRQNLIKADIWAKVIWGDISDPDELAHNLSANYGIDLSDLLNTRSFLDHNRVWQEPHSEIPEIYSSSTGAYAFEGKRLNNNKVSVSLKEHFEKWKPYLSKFGLVLIELHTLKPELAARNLGKTAATAYDATHGYSDQYIVELEEFNKILLDAGLVPDKVKSQKYPDSALATVSVNLIHTE